MTEEVPREVKDTTITVLHKNKYTLVAHTGKVLLKTYPLEVATSARKLEFFPRNNAASGPNAGQPIRDLSCADCRD